MASYTTIVSVLQTRSYQVEASNAEEAEEFVRGEFEQLEYDIIDQEVDDVTVEE